MAESIFPWIVKSGFLDESALDGCVARYLAGHGRYYLALYTDRPIQCGTAPAGKAAPVVADISTLLELRVFDDDSELWLHRTALGQPFGWRVADDAQLARSVAGLSDTFLKVPENHRLVQMQKLDIDAGKSGRVDETGMRRLKATGGGDYSLPIGERTSWVRLVNYLTYRNDNGQAVPADFRLAGFADSAEEG